MKITVPKGIKIGHCNDDYTGVTVVLCEKGCVCGADVRGGAPGTRETDLLRSEKAAQKVHAVVLTGGSAYGLESTCGVMEYLKDKGVGVKVGGKRVPIVCGAVIFDLIYDDYHWPDKAAGRKACENASADNVAFGQVGVGKGATVGKFRGMKYATKSGVGAATVKVAGVTVTAIVAVNALGDVIDTETRKIVAGCRGKKGNFVGAEQRILDGEYLKLLTGNTTIGCIITDAKLDKAGANKVASVAHNGLARTLYPVHTDFDGDSLFVMATGKRTVLNPVLVEIAAVKAVEKAVLAAVDGCADYEIDCCDDRETDCRDEGDSGLD